MTLREEPCMYYQSIAGCKKKNCPFWHVLPATLTGSFATENIWIPTDQCGIIIGKGGSALRRLQMAYGETRLALHNKEKNDSESQRLEVSADCGIIQSILMDMAESLSTRKKMDLEYLLPHLTKYGLHDCIEALMLSGQIKRKTGDQEVRPSKRPALMELPNGWGPMFDEQQHIADAIAAQETLEDIRGDEVKALPDRNGFLHLSQHIVLAEFDPRGSEHENCLRTRPQEIVTFVEPCVCSQNCGYGIFRNALEIIGCLPRQIISEEILKFECAYCDETNEFYQEMEYLLHLVETHFWRRITSFLEDHGAPYVCPINDCSMELSDFKTLIRHYGAIPHRKVGALILDSVGERVKNIRETKPVDTSSKEKIEKLNRYIKELKQELSNKSGVTQGDEYIDSLKTQISRAEAEVSDLKDQNEKLAKDYAACSEELRRKDAACKNTQENLKLKLKAETELRAEKERLEKELTKKGKADSETSKLKKEIADLMKLNKSLNDKIAKLEANAKSQGTSDVSHATIERLKKTIKSQKTLLDLREKEIALMREDNDCVVLE